MKLSRRGVFGAAAGGAVAAANYKTRPKAFGGPEPTYGSASQFVGSTKDNPTDNGEWTAKQLARAKRIAAGELLPEDEQYPTEGAQCPYLPLHSVSDSAKWFMRDRRARQWHRNRMIENARKALADWDQFGVFRSIF